MECLWEKVPLSTSYPLSLIPNPSVNKDPKAKDSAIAISIPFPASTASYLALKIFFIKGWQLKVSGIVFNLAPIDFKVSIGRFVFLMIPN